VASAQGEAANWFFGKQAGISFASGTAEAITYTPAPATPINTLEGSSTISDAAGNLLFYSDGTRVWNRNHEIMPNGSNLMGHRSSTQSGIIVPNPDDDTIFYIFTVGTNLTGGDAPSGTQGFRVYTVDMTLDGGLGAVVGGSETNLSDGKANRWTEKVTAVRQDDCGDYWVISLVDNSGSVSDDYTSSDYSGLDWSASTSWGSTFYAYRVSGTGVDPTPVKSKIPVDANEIKGYLKISPNGKYLAIANYDYQLTKEAKTFLFTFDLSTGEVGNDDDTEFGLLTNQRGLELMSRSDISTYGAPYGIEFDATSRFLYISSHDYNSGGFGGLDGDDEIHILQYDLQAVNVKSSQTVIHSEYGNVYRAGLQLSYGNQIFVTVPRSYYTDTQYLDLIEFPYLKGTAANYIESYIDLGPGLATQGLPPFIQSLFLNQLNITNNGLAVGDDGYEYLYLCVGDTHELRYNVNNPAFTYTWYKDGVLLPGETTRALTISYDGINSNNRYTLEVDKNDGTCPEVGISIVEFSPPPVAGTPSNIFECDDDVDGLFLFDLTGNTAAIMNGLDPLEYQVQYYTNEADAIADNEGNMILDPTAYQNQNPFTLETIYARLESTDLASCYEIVDFDINVTSVPEATQPVNYVLCDDDSDGDDANGMGYFDLSTKDAEILGGLDGTRYNVSYHLSQSDADNDLNPIDKNTDYLSGSVTIYVRVENISNLACLDTSVNFDLIVNEKPPLLVEYFEQTDCDNDGLDGADFKDLEDFIDTFIANPINYNVTFHQTLATAEAGIEAINNPQNYYATTETIFIRFEDKTTGCYSTGELSLTILSAQVTNTIEQTLVTCDTNENGINTFDLNELYDAFVTDYPYITESGATVNFYSTELDAQNNTNAIADWTNYNNVVAYDDIVYIRVDNGACFAFGKYAKLEIEPLPLTSSTVSDIEICDTDIDGFYNDFRLDDARAEIIGLATPGDYDISFYENTADRTADVNRLGDSYTNSVAFGNTIYVRIQDVSTGCINNNLSFQTIVLPAPDVNQALPLLNICDDDNNGYYSFDFGNAADQSYMQDLILDGLDPLDYTITYHNTEAQAQNNIDALAMPYSNAAAFAREVVYVRVQDNTSSCFAITSFEIQVNQNPVLMPLSDYELCDDDDDGNSNNGIASLFLFETRDELLIPNALERALFNISYHPSLTDAQNGTNIINKTLGYTNTNPGTQTIYVRVENQNDATCFETASFDIVVNPLPAILDPMYSFIVCDTNDDGLADYDLNSIINDISVDPVNTTIGFYSSELAAWNDDTSLKLPANQISSPSRTFYVRHENATGCVDVSTVEVEVVVTEIPSTFNLSLEDCDTNENGLSVFDFSAVQSQLLANYSYLDQPEVTIQYFDNLTDAQNNSNPISDISNYTNTTAYNQQIFIRVDNQGCFYVGQHIDLIVNPLPLTSATVSDIEVCDDDFDGFYDNFRFDQVRNQILNGQNPSLFDIAFYDSAADRIANSNALPDIYTNSIQDGNTIYVRIIDNTTNCINDKLSFNVIVNPKPAINFALPQVQICDTDQDGIVSVDFTDNSGSNYLDALILNGLNPADYTVTYHSSQGAANAASPLPMPYSNSLSEELIWVRVENNTSSCISITSFELQVNPAPNMMPLSNYELCDDDTDLDATNGRVNSFILSSKDAELIVNPVERNLFNISYHPSLSEAQSNTNAIDKNSGYTNTTPDNQTIFVRVENKNDPTCYQTTSFDLVVNPLPVILERNYQWIVCDTDNNAKSDFDLTDIISDISSDPANTTLTFFSTELAAWNNDNSFEQPANQINSSSRTFYVRHENASGCIDVSTVEVEVVVTQIPASFNMEFGNCDINENGISIFDFSAALGQLLANYSYLDQSGVIIQFFDNLIDAQNNNNPISDITNYTNSNLYNQEIFVRVDSQGCSYVGKHIDLIVNPLPLSSATVADLEVCDDDFDGFFNDFRLDLIRNDILGGANPADYDIAFYDSPSDRSSNSNALPDIYTNFNKDGNPIYVRIIDNNTGCINDKITFDLIVNPKPAINFALAQLQICDTDQDGTVTIDFSDNASPYYMESIILNGLNPAIHTITYHNSEAAANAGITLPMPYSNSLSEELIWVRVENNTSSCISITSFELQVNPAPNMMPLTNYELCDDDSDLDSTNGRVSSFILSTKDAELIVNPVERNLFNITYHPSLIDAQNNTNVINKNLGYTNATTNSQTIYVRVESKNDPTCYQTTSFDLIVNPLPVILERNYEWIICDTDNNAKSDFDLTDIISDISSDPANTNISFFSSELAAWNNDSSLELPANQINSSSGTFYVRHENASGCVDVSTVEVFVVVSQIPSSIQERLELCDLYESEVQDDTDGISLFNLSGFDSYLSNYFSATPNISIEYYETEQDAIDKVNPINNLTSYRNKPSLAVGGVQQIWTRVENFIEGNLVEECVYIGTHLTLEVLPIPSLPQNPENIELCDDDFDGQLIFDLKSKRDELEALNPNYFVSFHLNQNDANAQINALGDTYQSFGERIYIRLENRSVQDDNGTYCPNLSYYFDLVVNPLPIAEQLPDQEFCQVDPLSSLLINLHDLDNEVVQNLGPDYTVRYYLSELEARNATNEIGVLGSDFDFSNDAVRLWYRVEKSGITDDCYSVYSFNLYKRLLPAINDIGTYAECASFDGTQSFTLNDIAREVLGIGQLNSGLFEVRYFDSFNREIKTTEYIIESSEEIELRINNKDFPSCESSVVVNLEIAPIPEILVEDYEYILCDDDLDGVMSFDLTQIKQEITTDPIRTTLKFYVDENDAINDVNALLNPSNFVNSDYSTIYVRHENILEGDCFAISTVRLRAALSRFDESIRQTLYSCETSVNDPGFAFFDISAYDVAVKNLFPKDQPIEISHFYTREDAENNVNPISPTEYTNLKNTVAFQQFIYTRAFNSLAPECSLFVESYLTLEVNPVPVLNDFQADVCFNPDSGLSYPFAQFDLRDYFESMVDTGSLSGLKVEVFETMSLAIINTNPITDDLSNYINNAQDQVLFIRMENETTGCSSIARLTLHVDQLPNVPFVLSKLELCDTGATSAEVNDGIFEINDILPYIEDELLENAKDSDDYTISYYRTRFGAENADFDNRISFPFEVENFVKKIFIRVEDNLTSCAVVSEVSTELFESTNPVQLAPIEICDVPELTSTDKDGYYTFELGLYVSEILSNQVNVGDFEVSLHLSQNDADMNINPVDLNNFVNTEAFNQRLFVRVANKNLASCYDTSTYLDLVIKPMPNLNYFPDIVEGCDINLTGTYNFNLEDLKSSITDDTSLYEFISWYTTESGAKDIDNNTNLIPKTLYENYDVGSSTIWARVSINDCYRFIPVTLRVNPLPYLIKPSSIILCDYGENVSFDQIREEILEGSGKDDVIINYYLSEEDAINNENLLTSLNTTDIDSNTDVYVKLIDIETGCESPNIESFNISVNPIPQFEIFSPIVFCDGSEEVIVNIEQEDQSGYIYTWKDQNDNIINPLDAFGKEVRLTEAGTYTVIAENPTTGCVNVKFYEAKISSIAQIDQDDLIISDDVDGSKKVVIDESSLGLGDYEFSLNEFGPYQDQGVFNDLETGTHVIYIRDKNGCATASVEVTLLDFPRFFTPGGVGNNSKWNVRGIYGNSSLPLFQSGEIEIFDRYGKFITKISIYGEGWDGTDDGVELLPTDYWYYAKMVDQNGKVREYQGHFSLLK
jgi:gliding motility-associated-like protein